MPDKTRQLAAIMFTDIVGYSALAQKNEDLSLELLEEHRDLLRPLFPRFGGREIETIGDAFFLEFGSVLEAVKCAIEIQNTMGERSLDPLYLILRIRPYWSGIWRVCARPGCRRSRDHRRS